MLRGYEILAAAFYFVIVAPCRFLCVSSNHSDQNDSYCLKKINNNKQTDLNFQKICKIIITAEKLVKSLRSRKTGKI